ncbi:hypothetical protein AMTRI_Chr09g34160 [Amborella trichopoda]
MGHQINGFSEYPSKNMSFGLAKMDGGKKQKKFLTVAPFECVWLMERFRDAGRGCVTFEAFARNDITVVFREHAGTQNYHYKTDNTPHYTVILGSHRNRRLKIEVDGKSVVDVAGIGLCCTSGFQSYWISFCDGLISIGKGQYPFQDVVFQWLHSEPNCKVQYVGLSSWDKHVGYRNVTVMPLHQMNYITLQKHVNNTILDLSDDEEEDGFNAYEGWGLGKFLENWDLHDVFFVVGLEEKVIPAHRVILETCSSFGRLLLNENNVIRLPSISHPVLHALLQYIYTGRCEIMESQLGRLRDLSKEFEVAALVKRCEELVNRSKSRNILLEPDKKHEIVHTSFKAHRCTVFPCELPIDVLKLKQLLINGEHSDVDIYIDGKGLIARCHKLILSLWSIPFAKMFTNGMSESKSSRICLRDVHADAFLAMLHFMYTGEFKDNDSWEMGSLLLPLLVLSDQYGVDFLQQECCKYLLDCLSEESLCHILQVVSLMPTCKLLEELCVKKFARNFDYCTTASTDFVKLDEPTFLKILQHPSLTVTSEERVLDAVLMWCMQAGEVYHWETSDELLNACTPDLLFRDRIGLIHVLLPLVRFPLMPVTLLKRLEKSNLNRQIPVFQELVKEAIEFADTSAMKIANEQNMRFQHRPSSFKELQYICDGDQNGVLYYSGTSYGEHDWVNPFLAKRVIVTASSPASRYTDPKSLVSRTYQATSFAGPRIVGGKNCAWWKIDIGQDHELMCNYYTIRQDGSTGFTRHWSLQGSRDAENWTDLRVHENDRTICKPAQFASWPIHPPNALLPFRFFRVLLTGLTTSDSNPWNLCMCFLELYGYFR